MKLSALSLSLFLLTACSANDRSISESITAQFDASSSAPVNLALVGPKSWSRVCVLGPYSTNETAEQVLGFKWNIERAGSVGRNDGINLLVFVHEQKVVAFTEHSRSKGDFLNLSPRCLERNKATLARVVEPSGWVQLVAE